MLVTDWNPESRKLCNLNHCFIKNQCPAIIRNVTCKSINRVVCGEDREDGVHGVEYRLTDGVGGGDKDIDAREFRDAIWEVIVEILRAERSGMLLTGLNLGSWLRSHEKPNQASPATDKVQNHMTLELLCLMRQTKNTRTAIRRTKISALSQQKKIAIRCPSNRRNAGNWVKVCKIRSHQRSK
jgi:hypothetical protein